MSRIIKFRAYIEDEKRFIYCDDSDENYLGTFFRIVRQIEQMSGKKIEKDQFTGLFDKNGYEVYEHDILRFRFYREVRVGDVRWSEYGFYVYPTKTVHDMNEWVLHPSSMKRPEVIGNIYENPKLMK